MQPMSRKRKLRARAGVSLVALVALLVACTGGKGAASPEADPVRMSESEYDVARDLWLRQNRPREALAHALEAVELDEENADACHLVALLYLQFCSDPTTPGDCRLDAAEKYARAAAEARESFREAKNTLGVVLIHRKQYSEAIAVLKTLTEDILYQTPENAWGNLGWAYLELGKLDLAVDALRRAMAAQPMFCVGSFRLGVALERKRRLTEAREALTQALETNAPGCGALQEAYAARTRVLIALGQKSAARADLRRCAELSEQTPTGKECRSMLANLK
jgi:type IV pilus assembly protein PilF